MSNSPTKTIEANESYLGYVLRERIGAGGYGEVWSAEAPGGMLKAVKFIYGFHDDNRAQRELKALDRIKEVRHPFLLSLERIDVVDGRMIVITELADMCLKQRFNSCREEGLDGIPREELLSYMKEASDALDYIADNFSLAHLDIKPENLLLVGHHIKVADFGLVKDIHNANQSLMDGLTPAYASPELFDGQPGRASDQYSLAIVYQEMLTSTRPFSGTTAAQLASQHIHSRPNLNSLPRSDQAVIARALSKVPDKRFVDCRTMVEELAKRRSRARPKASSAPKSELGSLNTSELTSAGVDIKAVKPDQTMTISESFIPAIKFEASVEKLDPYNLENETPEIRPTFFVGVGHTGTQTLCRLRRRLSNRYGNPESMPAIRMLCLDVDRRSLFDSTLGNDSESLRSHEILNVPLRKPEEYRNDTSIDTSWIGRRWIYNIPKSQLTESLRPLGRLAFVDHHEKIYQKIHDELEKLSAPEALATTADTIGLSPGEVTPQVVIVGSTSGGIGSGMILDLAYSIRVGMGELGLSDEFLYGLLAHSTARNSGDNRLSIANTYSFLNEYFHYNLNGFPGSPYCGIPSFDQNTPAFDAAYLLHLGDALQDEEYESAIDAMAEYLYLSTATRCTAFFDACRANDEDYDSNTLRSMGISFVSRGKSALSDIPAQTISNKLLKRWLDGEPSGSDHESQGVFKPAEFAAQLLADSLLGQELNSTFGQIIQEELGNEPVSLLLSQIDEGFQGHPAEQKLKLAKEFLDQRLGEPSNSQIDGVPQDPTLCEVIDSKIPRMVRRTRDDLSEKVFNLIDDPHARIFGANAAAHAINESLQVLAVSLEPTKLQLQADLEECVSQFRDTLNAKSSQQEQVAAKRAKIITRYVEARLRLIQESFKRKLVAIVRIEMTSELGGLGELSQKLNLVNQQLSFAAEVNPAETDVYGDEEKKDLRAIMIQQFVDRADSLLPTLESVIEEKYLSAEGGLLSLLREGTHRLRALPELIRRESQNVVNNAMQELRIDSILRDSALNASEIANWLNWLVESANPKLLECGGTSRLLLAVPQKAPVTSIAGFIQNQFDHEANVVSATSGELAVCYEMNLIPMENVAMSILQLQPDCAELINRLHVRNDVEWTSLTPLC